MVRAPCLQFSTRLNCCAAEYEPPFPEQLTVIVTVEVPALAAALPLNVSVKLMFPDVAVFTLVMVTVTPEGSPVSVNVPTGLNPPNAVTVTAIAPVPVRTIASDLALSANSTPGDCETWTEICLLSDNPSPLAVTVIVAAPTVADEAAVSVSVEEPASPLNVTGLLLHRAVIPLGSPPMPNVTAPANVPLPVKETKSAIVFPCTTDREVEATATASVGAMAGASVTCIAICAATANPSPLAVTVIVVEPTAADDEAVRVSVEEPLSPLRVTGLLLHDAVTPLGSPLTLSVTAPA
jgi:hypothetical protein